MFLFCSMVSNHENLFRFNWCLRKKKLQPRSQKKKMLKALRCKPKAKFRKMRNRKEIVFYLFILESISVDYFSEATSNLPTCLMTAGDSPPPPQPCKDKRVQTMEWMDGVQMALCACWCTHSEAEVYSLPTQNRCINKNIMQPFNRLSEP